MTRYLLEARDAMVIRGGRPNRGRSESRTLSFPYPSTLAGLVRTRLGSNEEGSFELKRDQLPALRQVGIRGPLLIRRGSELLVPAPQDALVLTQGEDDHLLRAHPISEPAGLLTDVKDELRYVGFEQAETRRGKPCSKAPRFWPWRLVQEWLLDGPLPRAQKKEWRIQLREAGGGGGEKTRDAAKVLHALGLRALPREERVHVALDETGTAVEGQLVSTEGLRFRQAESQIPAIGEKKAKRTLDDFYVAQAPPKLDKIIDLALLVDVPNQEVGGQARTLRSGAVPAAGERRVARWARSEFELPPPPEDLLDYVSQGPGPVALRMLLLTPACFNEGWCPGESAGQLFDPSSACCPKLTAACVSRPKTVSGWDFELGGPKATKRLVPAGSVYWIDLPGTPEQRVRWVRDHWMQNISDEKQDRLDGFGLAVFGRGE